MDLCADAEVDPPEFSFTGFFTVTFKRMLKAQVAAQAGTKSVPSLSQVCPKSVPSDIAAIIIKSAVKNISLKQLMDKTGQTNRTRFKNSIINPLLDTNLIEMTIPDKPRSSKQKYRLTEKGRELLEKLEQDEK